MTRGEKVIAFIERYCRIPSGDHVGKPMLLEGFEKKFVLEVYDNPYRTRRAYLSVAKKNGKTGLIAGIVLAHVVGPEARQNSEIASGAQSRDQAGIVFERAAQMIRLNPKLEKLTRIVPSSKRIIGISRNVVYKALSAEGKTAHGGSLVLAILDEVGQVEGPRDAFVSAIQTSQDAYDDSLLIAISTQAESDADMFSMWLDAQESAPDPRVVSHVYTAPAECALDDRSAWAAANPALGKFKSLSGIEHAAALAIQMPANESEFRNFHLNQRVEKTDPFVTRSVWESNGEAPADLTGKKIYAGLDLASVNDLCALVLGSDEGDIEPHFWLPAHGLNEKSKKDRVPWDLWAAQGLLHTTPGRAVEYEYIAEFLRGVFDRCDVQALAFDRYNMKHLKPWLVKAGFSDAELERFVEFGQGTLSMTPALRELEVRLLNGKLKHGQNPIMKMCAANARVVGDSGARKFDKIKSRGRIDGMVAMAEMVGVMPSKPASGPSVYEDRGLLIL